MMCRITFCWCCCTTSRATAGRWVRCRGTLRRCTGRGARGWRRRLAPLPVQYADYTLWQQAVLGDEDEASSVLSRQLGYWKTALADLPEQIELPSDRARPQVCEPPRRQRCASGRCASCTGGLSALARGTGASLFMVLQAALAGLLSRLGAGSDIAIGSPIAGRGDARAGRSDRVLRQHAGAAHRHVGQPGVCRTDRAGAGEQPCGLWPCGCAVRASGGGAQSGAVAVAASAVPGDAGVRGGVVAGGRWS